MAEHDPHLGLRRGAWNEAEDAGLRQCIEEFGEGKWHQVPRNAGLNRCRKSCRLRWLNHLKPNIKRGEFDLDEVDLIIRLYKLLGNRWSLIAGRLPGRTSGDVKNYLNTHLRKKDVPGLQMMNNDHQRTINHAAVACVDEPKVIKLKPCPWTIQNQPQGQLAGADRMNAVVSNAECDSSSPLTDDVVEQIQWWKSLLTEADQVSHHEKAMASGSCSTGNEGYMIEHVHGGNLAGADDIICAEDEEMLAGLGFSH